MSKTTARHRVLYVEGNVDSTIGGSFFSLLFLVQGLDKSRYEPIVVFSFPHRLIPRFEAAGARVLIRPLVPAVRGESAAGRLLARAVNFALGFVIEPARLAYLYLRHRIDLVHLNNSIIRNHQWMIAARMLRLPCVTHERGINSEYPALARSLGRNLKAVICISDAVRDNFTARGVNDLRVVTIPNGLDPAEMIVRSPCAQIRRELGVPEQARLIGIVGNLKRWKGQEVVINAMQTIASRFPNVVCVLIGDFAASDGEYRNHIMQLIDRLQLANRVIVTGYRPNVADYMNSLEIVIHASIDPEPFGRVLLEGMALRKPLVASRGGAVPEIVVDGETGLLFEPGNATDLAGKLTELLLDRPRCIAMGERGYARLSNIFSIGQNVLRTTSLYERVLAGK